MAEAFCVLPGAYPRGLNVVGEIITVLASGARTGGYEIFLQQGGEGSGPPPHSHEWDESFYVTKGVVELTISDETIEARAGTLVHLPAGTVHWFRFGPGGGEMLSMTSRAGASKLFTEIDAEIPPGTHDMNQVAGIITKHGVKIAVPPTQ